jgi:hypothetical protein
MTTNHKKPKKKKAKLKILKLLDDSSESKTYQDTCPLSFLENQKKRAHFMPF